MERQEDRETIIDVDLGTFSRSVVLKTCVRFLDRLTFSLEADTSQGPVLHLRITAKCSQPLPALIAEFRAELIDQATREVLLKETKAIRELIVAQAFAEADLLDRSLVNAAYLDDPKGIGK